MSMSSTQNTDHVLAVAAEADEGSPSRFPQSLDDEVSMLNRYTKIRVLVSCKVNLSRSGESRPEPLETRQLPRAGVRSSYSHRLKAMTKSNSGSSSPRRNLSFQV